MDRLAEEGVSVVGQEKRKPIYRQIQAILREDLPVLPIFYYVNIEGTKAGLQNYQQNANLVSNVWNANAWWWAK